MKTNLFVVLLVLGAICASSPLVNADCSSLINQYYSCRHLKMITFNTTDEYGIPGVKYFRDYTVENNTLDEEFFSKELDNMDMDEAMKLFKTIFDTIENCTSEFCQCIASGIPDKRFRYGKIFADPTKVEQVKTIIQNFNNKFEITSREPTNSLEKFCLLYSFGMEKLELIPGGFDCLVSDADTV